MNVIDRIRIRNNPNIISKMNNITEEMVDFSIKSGYEPDRNFKRDIDKFYKYKSFVDKFKNRPELISFFKAKSLSEIKEFYCDNDVKSLYDFIVNNSLKLDKSDESIIIEILNALPVDKKLEFINSKGIFYNPEFQKEICLKYAINNLGYIEGLPTYITFSQEFLKKEITTDIEDFYNNPQNYFFDWSKLTEDDYSKILNQIQERNLILPFHLRIDRYYPIFIEKLKLYSEGKIDLNNYFYELLSTHLSDKTPQEILEFYKKYNIEITDYNNYKIYSGRINPLVYIECVKKGIIPSLNAEEINSSTLEIDKQIYEALKGVISLESIQNNEFLKSNIYFALDLFEQDKEFDFNKVRNLDSINLPERIKQQMKKENKNKIIISNDFYIKNNELIVKFEDIESVKNAIKYIQENGIDINIRITMKYKKPKENILTENLEYLKNLLKDNVRITFEYTNGSVDDNSKRFDLKSIIRDELFLKYIVDEIKSKKISPFEMYIAIYDIVKNFKRYTLEPEDEQPYKSRSLYEYLNNSFFVCVGYSDLYANLCKKLGLECSMIGCKVEGDENGHEINYIKIKDDKYSIDGYYVLDSTNEIDTGHLREEKEFLTYYGKFANTFSKFSSSNKDYYDYDIEISKLNQKGYVIQHIQQIIKIMQNLDPEFYEKIKDLDFSKENDENFEMINDYFDKKIDNEIPKRTFTEAVVNVKRGVYKNYSESDFEFAKIKFLFDNEVELSEEERLFFQEYLTNNFYENNKDKTIEFLNKNEQTLFNAYCKLLHLQEFNGKKYADVFEDKNKEMFEKINENIELLRNENFIVNIKTAAKSTKKYIQIHYPKSSKRNDELTLQEYVEQIKASNEAFENIIGYTDESTKRISA